MTGVQTCALPIWFPEAEFTCVNAGIGGTTSHFGAARAEEDLLYARPDVVFVEFSVNDDDEAHFKECYEGLPKTYIPPCLLKNIFKFLLRLGREPAVSKWRIIFGAYSSPARFSSILSNTLFFWISVKNPSATASSRISVTSFISFW